MKLFLFVGAMLFFSCPTPTDQKKNELFLIRWIFPLSLRFKSGNVPVIFRAWSSYLKSFKTLVSQGF